MLDRTVHKRVRRTSEARDLIVAAKPFSNPKRLALVLLVYLHGRMGFTDLQKLLDLTPGNLDHHLKALKGIGIVRMRKRFGWRPMVVVELTPDGAEAFLKYADKLRGFLDKIEE